MMAEPEPGYCSCGRHASDQCELCRKHIDGKQFEPADNDPEVTADKACEIALNALDDLMVLAAKDDTAHLVMANRIFIGQILTRAQLVASFLMAQQTGLRIVKNG